jgi:protein-S-isoprenylcysteine O-methyltransferase Ste14
MKSKITRWGVGPKFLFFSVGYSLFVVIIHYTILPELRFIIYHRLINIISGTVLIVTGFTLFIIPAFVIDKYFEKGELATKGVYSIMRHPIYGSWIVFIIPGIVLLHGSVLGISVPVFMYFIFRIVIKKEEDYLLNKFGNDFKKYKKSVNAIFPTIRLKKN